MRQKFVIGNWVLSPAVGALFMTISTVVVLINAMLLRRMKS